MKPHHVERFLQRWCLAVTRSNKPDADISSIEIEAQNEVRDLIRYINTSEGVQLLSTNPLLLNNPGVDRPREPFRPKPPDSPLSACNGDAFAYVACPSRTLL